MNATKAAVEEGIIAGGGSTLISIYKELIDTLKNEDIDTQKGINIVLESLKKPLFQIAENSGFKGKDIVDKQLKEKNNIGFNAKTGEWVDMFEKGIVDPCKVARSGILNAASISGLFITTEAAVGSIKEQNPPMENSPMGGMY